MMASCLTKIDRYQATGCEVSLIAGPVVADPAVAAAPPDEPVAGAPHRPVVAAAPGVVAQLLPQPADQDVDRAVVGLPVHAAGLLPDRLPGQPPPAAPRPRREE